MLGARQAPVTHPCSQRAVSNLGIHASHAFVAPTTLRSHAGPTTESQPESFASGSIVQVQNCSFPIAQQRDPAKRIPLEVVRSLQYPAGWCFPSPTRAGKHIQVSTLAQVVKRIYGDRCTVHGFRTSFRTWASEQTSVPHAVAEAALAHQVGNAVERSYARSDLFEKRRVLMDRWAEFVTR